MLTHSGFHFFLTMSFKPFNVLNEAFELYQRGRLKTGCKTIKGNFSCRRTLTYGGNPLPPVIAISLNSTLGVNLFFLTVNVADATQTLVKRGRVTPQHRTRYHLLLTKWRRERSISKALFLSQNALSMDYMCWVSREVFICYNTAALSNFTFFHCPFWKSSALVS